MDRRRTRYLLLFRALAWLIALVYFGQAVLAGQFLSGTYPALRMHQLAATAADVLLFAAIVVTALLRWRAKGPIWPFWAVLGLAAVAQAQNAAGAARLIQLHIPLGVAMLVAAVLMALFASLPGERPGKSPAAKDDAELEESR